MEVGTRIPAHVVVEYDAHGRRIQRLAAFVAGAASIQRLRVDMRLVGVTVGRDVARGDLDDKEDGGIRLSLAQVVVGVAHGLLELAVDEAVDVPRVREALLRIIKGQPDELFALSELELLRLRVFADLWKSGFFVAFGSKFGVDYLVYEADPSTCHSFAMVVVRDCAAEFATVDIVSHCRVAKMVKKQLLLASQRNAQVVYLSLDHAVLATARPVQH